tara:strand:- start:596 stop:847 length:252 start_codon:yes stop_codon:yes gene_type:complete
MYSIEFSEIAKKQLNKLELNIKERILRSLERIKIRPYSFIKRKEGTPYFIFRVGNYRVILKIENNKLLIFILELGLRGKVYKK